MSHSDYLQSIRNIRERDPRYHADAYDFVREGLDYTIKDLQKPLDGPDRHISGQELMDGMRRYALREFGPMARSVFHHWGIHETICFGHIVFNMVEEGILGKTEEDSVEDFKELFDFDQAFVTPFLPSHA